MTNPITPAELEAWRALCEKANDALVHLNEVAAERPGSMEHRVADDTLHDVLNTLRVRAAVVFPRLLDEITRLRSVIREYDQWLCKIAGNLPNVRQSDNTDEFMEYLQSLWDEVREWHAKQTDNK